MVQSLRLPHMGMASTALELLQMVQAPFECTLWLYSLHVITPLLCHRPAPATPQAPPASILPNVSSSLFRINSCT